MRSICFQLRTIERGLAVISTFRVFKSGIIHTLRFRNQLLNGDSERRQVRSDSDRDTVNRALSVNKLNSPWCQYAAAALLPLAGSPPPDCHLPILRIRPLDGIARRGARTGGREAGWRTAVCPPSSPERWQAASANKQP